VPPSSFLPSDPLLLVLGSAFLLRLPQLVRERLLDLRAAAALTIGFSIPAFLMLTFFNMAFRYRMEFCPFLEFTAFLGFFANYVKRSEFSVLSRGRLSLIPIASAGLGIVCSHLLLFLYKISPDTNRISTMNGWLIYTFLGYGYYFPASHKDCICDEVVNCRPKASGWTGSV
jgi:hypothetical protein